MIPLKEKRCGNRILALVFNELPVVVELGGWAGEVTSHFPPPPAPFLLVKSVVHKALAAQKQIHGTTCILHCGCIVIRY